LLKNVVRVNGSTQNIFWQKFGNSKLNFSKI